MYRKSTLRNSITERVRSEPHLIYHPQKYLCVYTAEPKAPGLPSEYLYRNLDALSLMALVNNAELCGIKNLHLYLIRHDKPPVPVDYLLRGNHIDIYDRRGIYVERRFV